MISERQQNELNHDKHILVQSEKVWGREGKAGKLRVERRAKMIVDYGKINKETKILEIGCGTGTLTELLVKTGANIVATDIFPEFLDAAKKRTNSPNVIFQLADAEKLENFPDESFDVVCGLSILHHLDIEKTFDSIKRVLKNGGCLIFSEPNMLNPQIALQKNIPFIKKMAGDSPDETAFFVWKLKNILKNKGFTDLKIESFDFLHPSIPDGLAIFIDKVGKILDKTPIIKEIAGSIFIGARK